MLTFRDSNESFKLDGNLLKTLSKNNFIVGFSDPRD